MKRRREICEKCRFFFSGEGSVEKKRYAFCMNTDLHGKSAFYESVASANPDACLEKDFFGKSYNEEILSECPFKAEQLMEVWNEKKH
jgi:hypothetical protein